MSPSAGDRLGPYEIVGRLRAGGMGEVYWFAELQSIAGRATPATNVEE